jgi:uncharacterized DUF497 family protein
VKFTWDPEKDKLNKRKHRVSFEEACYIFADPFILTIYDDDHSEDEELWVSIGKIVERNIYVVARTHQVCGNEEYVRIISARRASADEKRIYLSRAGRQK